MGVNYTSYGTPRADLGEAIREYNPALDGFIGLDVLPPRPVVKKAATISVITRESYLKRVDAKHANGAGLIVSVSKPKTRLTRVLTTALKARLRTTTAPTTPAILTPKSKPLKPSSTS